MIKKPKRFHLMHQKYPEVWYLQDIEKDGFGAMYDGKISITNTDDVLQANSIPELLLKMRDDENDLYWCVTDWYGSDGTWRHEEYGIHQSIHRIRGYVSDICRFRYDDTSGLRDWELLFISEIWIRENDTMQKVKYYSEKVVEEVFEFIKKNTFH